MQTVQALRCCRGAAHVPVQAEQGDGKRDEGPQQQESWTPTWSQACLAQRTAARPSQSTSPPASRTLQPTKTLCEQSARHGLPACSVSQHMTCTSRAARASLIFAASQLPDNPCKPASRMIMASFSPSDSFHRRDMPHVQRLGADVQKFEIVETLADE